jgi:hypothetical protein
MRRIVAALLVVALAGPVAAQEPPPPDEPAPSQPPYPSQPYPSQPYPSQPYPSQPYPQQPAQPYPQQAYPPPPPPTSGDPSGSQIRPVDQSALPPSTSSYGSPTSTIGAPTGTTAFNPPAPQPFVSSELLGRWHTARNLYGFGTITGLLGTGLTLSSIIVVAATGYPCDPTEHALSGNTNDSCNPNSPKYHPAKPTDAATLLAYMGSSASALGFVFSASGLGYQHAILKELGNDPGRDVFHAGTAFGVLGFASVGAGYFFGLTHYLNSRDQALAILSTTIIGAGLCELGSLLYTIDASRTKKAFQKYSTW